MSRGITRAAWVVTGATIMMLTLTGCPQVEMQTESANQAAFNASGEYAKFMESTWNATSVADRSAACSQFRQDPDAYVATFTERQYALTQQEGNDAAKAAFTRDVISEGTRSYLSMKCP